MDDGEDKRCGGDINSKYYGKRGYECINIYDDDDDDERKACFSLHRIPPSIKPQHPILVPNPYSSYTSPRKRLINQRSQLERREDM